MNVLFGAMLLLGSIVKNPSYPVSETPQLPLEVYADEFAAILGKEPKLIHLAEGFGFTEGPVYLSSKIEKTVFYSSPIRSTTTF